MIARRWDEAAKYTMSDELFIASRAFVHSLYEAKTRVSSYEDLFADRAPNAAYNRLFKTVEKVTPVDVAWRGGFWEFACSFGDTVWENDIPEEKASLDFAAALQNSLEDLAAREWIASVPLERAFEEFPAFTDFGPFAIVNAGRSNPDCPDALLRAFQEILTAHMGVTFMDSVEVQESYLYLADHFCKKSGYYIPGRPQLVIATGRGECRGNQQLLQDRLRQILPLLQICQVAYELQHRLSFTHGGTRMPDGVTRMPDGLIEIPGVAVAINRRTGQADWWLGRQDVFETKRGSAYECEEFKGLWCDIAAPVLKARDAGLSGAVRDAVDRALGLVATCRHSEMGNVALNSVIATETVLNPFGVIGEVTERFALMAAALTERSPLARRETYRTAKRLYQRRSHAVHRSRLHEGEGSTDLRTIGQDAFRLFLKSLKAVVQWAHGKLSSGEPCNQEAYYEFYLESIFPTP